jgi:hypothetical protein
VDEIEYFEAHLASAGRRVVGRHFRQAKSALDRGDWEAANAQTRAFLDALCEEVAACIPEVGKPYPLRSPKGGEARKHLQQTGFLGEDEADLLKALFKVLHGKGSHPGTSSERDAHRRFMMAICLANYYVERLHEREEARRADLFRIEHFAETILGRRYSMSIGFAYKSLEFDTVEIEGEDIVLETNRASSSRPSTLGDQWIKEFADALSDSGIQYAIVVTEEPIEAESRHVTRHSDGIYIAYDGVVLVEVPPIKYDKAAARRIRTAKRLLAARIREGRKESNGLSHAGRR